MSEGLWNGGLPAVSRKQLYCLMLSFRVSTVDSSSDAEPSVMGPEPHVLKESRA